MEKENRLLQEEVDRISELIEEYRKVYTEAAKIGKQIETLQGEMVKISAKMTNISSDENQFYQKIGDRLGIEVEKARALILEEIQEKINNQKEN
jgi:hypothetical protein